MTLPNLFGKAYKKILRKEYPNGFIPQALTIFNKGGIPLTSHTSDNILQGGLFTALNSYVQKCFETELNTIKFGNNTIIFKKSKHLLGSLIIKNTAKIKSEVFELGLNGILDYLESNCPEFEREKFNSHKIENLVEQYITNHS